jgi:hypothetical protein
MNSWKEHIVGCANCQAVLAHLETTDEIPLRLQAVGKEGVLAAKEAEPLLAGRRAEASSESAAPSDIRHAATAVPSAKLRRARLLRGPRWQWLAPAGAIAAALLVWVAWHENQAPPLPNPADVKIAENRPAPAPPLPVEREASPPRPSAASPKPPTLSNDQDFSTARPETDALKQKQAYTVGDIPTHTNRSAEKEPGIRKGDRTEAPAELLGEAKPENLEDKSAVAALEQRVQRQAQAPNVQSQNQSQNQPQNQYRNASPSVVGPAPLGQMESAKRMKAAPIRGRSNSPEAASTQGAPSGDVMGYNAVSSALVAVSKSRLIRAPGSNVFWRPGPAGLLEYSKDGGASWSRQTSGVLVDLLSGSAPSDKICWIVGRAGAVLLTTDGGDHWKAVIPPLAEDLGGVLATDALHATIWNLRNTKSFETADGGVTWKPVPAPQ